MLTAAPRAAVDLDTAAGLTCGDVLAAAGSSPGGLSAAEAAKRLAAEGANTLQAHVAGPLDVLLGQMKNPLLLLLSATAVISIVLHDATDATIILSIIVLSVGLGFVNEFRAQRALAELHAKIHRSARVIRDAVCVTVDVSLLVRGDIVNLNIGDIVPADIRLLESRGLTCDEAVISGESLPAEKAAVSPAVAAGDLSVCVMMGTIVRSGTATGARRMAKQSVLVKRLVSIEDLGNMTVLFTDKTGTLTTGAMAFCEALDVNGRPSMQVVELATICAATLGSAAGLTGNVTSALDAALLRAAPAQRIATSRWRALDMVSFDYDRRLCTVLVLQSHRHSHPSPTKSLGRFAPPK